MKLRKLQERLEKSRNDSAVQSRESYLKDPADKSRARNRRKLHEGSGKELC